MKRFGLVFLLFVAGVAFAAPVQTPSQVRDAIGKVGAHAFFASLSDDDAETLFNHIATGRDAWVALAPQLAPGADAGNGEGLGIALAEALPKNAKAVLAVTESTDADGHPIAVSRVCGIPFVETVPRGYKAKAERAVRGVKVPQLQDIRTRCLTELEKSLLRSADERKRAVAVRLFHLWSREPDAGVLFGHEATIAIWQRMSVPGQARHNGATVEPLTVARGCTEVVVTSSLDALERDFGR